MFIFVYIKLQKNKYLKETQFIRDFTALLSNKLLLLLWKSKKLF